MFQWTQETISWMLNASCYNHYHRNLALYLLKFLDKEESVCDMGCGIGLLSMELARRCRHVTALDWDSLALSVLKDRPLPNLNIVCENAMEHVPEQPYDTVICCLFGTGQQLLEQWERDIGRKMIVIKSEETQRGFSLAQKKRRKESIYDVYQTFQAAGAAGYVEQVELEYGQPFRSLMDAIRFFIYYNCLTEQTGDKDRFLESVKKALHVTGDPVYPYYYPRKKRLGVMVVEKPYVRSAVAERHTLAVGSR